MSILRALTGMAALSLCALPAAANGAEAERVVDLDASGIERAPANAAANSAATVTEDVSGALGIGRGSGAPVGAGQAQVGPPPPVRATLVLKAGDAPPGTPVGDTVSTLNAPFTNGDGELGTICTLTPSGDRAIFKFNGVSFLSSSIISNALTGGEGTIGQGDGTAFVYSPSIDGEDGVWSHQGLLAASGPGAQAADLPAGQEATFHSRPTMTPSGRAHWVAGVNDDMPVGTATRFRVLYTSSDGSAANALVLLRGDGTVGPFTIDRQGIDFDYSVSGDGTHVCLVLDLLTGLTTDDGAVYADGAIVAQESLTTGGADNWANFDNVGINDLGNYLFSGDTDGATTTDEFIAYNGVIAVREGDVVDGVTLTTSVNALSINNLNQAIYVWTVSGGEALFFASDASSMAASSKLLLRTGDAIDEDGDGVGDWTVTDFNASGVIGPGLDLAENGIVYVELDVDDGLGAIEAIVALSARQGSSPSFCDASDGALASCPCANPGNPDSGCENAGLTGGVRLDVLAQATAPNGATLRGTGFPPAAAPTAIVIRSNALDLFSPVVFGDGLRCVSASPLVRLAASTASGGASTHVLGHSAMAGAGTFFYQVWYRSTPSTFCDAFAAFNLSSGSELTW